MSESRLVRRTLTEFFRDLLRRACRDHSVETQESTEHYLVSLLTRFARPDPVWISRPLALQYLESFHEPPSRRFAQLRGVADTSLFVSGILIEHVEHGIVSHEYYVSLGRQAYRQMSTLGPARPFGHETFREIAERFPTFVTVLAEISFRDIFPGEIRLVRRYARWLRTRNRADAEWLVRQGLSPVDPGGSDHLH